MGLSLIQSNREGLDSLKGSPCTTMHHDAGSPPWKRQVEPWWKVPICACAGLEGQAAAGGMCQRKEGLGWASPLLETGPFQMKRRRGTGRRAGPFGSFGSWGTDGYGKLLPFMSSLSACTPPPRSPQASFPDEQILLPLDSPKGVSCSFLLTLNYVSSLPSFPHKVVSSLKGETVAHSLHISPVLLEVHHLASLENVSSLICKLAFLCHIN